MTHRADGFLPSSIPNELPAAPLIVRLAQSQCSRGYGTRVGLMCVDYATLKRTPKLSASLFHVIATENALV
jgi:hypothetical protein